ncbi:MAG: winged helix-turn-helix transcriptional regulator [Sporichthyaceae bacterium]
MRRATDRSCPIARTLGSVGEYWTLLVVRDLWFYGPQRFEDLRQGLDVSSNTLTNRLGRLTEYGIVAREAYQSNPERFEYRLTERGAELVPALTVLAAWGNRHLPAEGGLPVVLRHRDSRHQVRPRVVCERWGEPVSRQDLHLEHGPGAVSDARPYANSPGRPPKGDL